MEVMVAGLVPAVLAAGRVIVDIYEESGADRAGLARMKGDGSPVTRADEAAEALLLPALAQVAPDIAVISEESEASHLVAPEEAFFLVDPLDGTKEFLRANSRGHFTVNIGLIRQGVPVMGIIYAPLLDALYVGIADVGAFKYKGALHKGEWQEGEWPDERRAVTVRSVPLSGAVATVSSSHLEERTTNWLAHHQVNDSVSVGSSLKFCLLAEGGADIYPRFGPTMEWDTAAGDAILRAAGGQMLTPDGAPYLYGKAGYRSTPFIAAGGWRAP